MRASISIRNAAYRQCKKKHLRNPSSCCNCNRYLPGETNMRPQVLLVALAVCAVLVALPLGNAHQEVAEGVVDASRSRWPCCDECGICTRSQPPICQCRDTSTSGCNPGCKACVRSINDGLYECKDRIVNFCKFRCTRPAAGDA